MFRFKIVKKLFILFMLSQLFCFAQTKQIDSLQHVLKTAKEDTNKVNLLNKFSSLYWGIGKLDSSLKYGTKANILAQKLGFKKGIASSYNLIGNTYLSEGNYPESLKNQYASLKIREEMGDKKGMAASYNNIGNIYNMRANYPEALKNYFASLKIKKEIGNKPGMAYSYGNIGSVYMNQSKYAEARENYLASIKIDEEIGNLKGIATSYNNIGNIYYEEGNPEEALKNFFASIKIKEELGDVEGLCRTYGNIGTTYIKIKNLKEAEKFGKKELSSALEIGSLDLVLGANLMLSEVYENTGRPKLALEKYRAYIVARDSINNEENTKKSVRIEMNYAFDKKEAAAKLEQEKKEAISMAESKKQKIIIESICGILILVLVFAIFAYRSYLQKQKANEAITRQKEVIEEKQKEILDSIHYAWRIQTALLPSEIYISKNISRLNKKR
jgi:tetratricopeptide (TPR) repeat protein